MMRFYRLFVVLCLMPLLMLSCKKEHYDVTKVQGVNAEGELLLPLVSKSFTMADMMESFQMDSLIHCSETGELSYNFSFEDHDVLDGQKLLRFNDMDQHAQYTFVNPYGYLPPITFDTMLSFEQTVEFKSDNISVSEAVMKSGRLDFTLASNLGKLNRVVLRSPDLQDASGNAFVLDETLQDNSFGFDLADLKYRTAVANHLTFSYDLYFSLHPNHDPELFMEIDLKGRDMAMRKVSGTMNPYSSRNVIDTLVSLFPGNLSGTLGLEGTCLRLSERNSFPLDARLVVDTALMTGNGASYSLIEPLPLVVDLPSQAVFDEVLVRPLNAKIDASGGHLYSSSMFIITPSSAYETITVEDTCSVDLKVDVDVPFAFRVDDVSYVDTVELKLSDLEMPDLIESITLELTIASTLPLNLNGQFCLFDSANETVTDVLLDDAQLIQASFDGQPTSHTVSVDITEERVEHALRSDCIIMRFAIDTDAHTAKLNANQKLDLFVKTKVKYNGVVEL